MQAKEYKFLLTEDGLPDYANFEFRTECNILYSCFFMKNKYIGEYLDFENLSNGYEYGLCEVEEKEKYVKRETDYRIKHTIVAIISEILEKHGKEFLITIKYSNVGGKSYKRMLVFDRWYKEFEQGFPLRKFDAEILIGENKVYKSIILHSEHKNYDNIIEEFSSST